MRLPAWLQRWIDGSAPLRRLQLKRDLKSVRRRNPRDEDPELSAQERGIHEELLELECEPLLRRARKLRVRIPPTPGPGEYLNDWWEYGPVKSDIWLTQKGWDEVRSAIREEEKQRREVWNHRREWLGLFLNLGIGFLGTAAALVSALAALAAFRRGSLP